MDNFLVIAVTSPLFFANEAEKINSILRERRADFVHIRKPQSSIEETDVLLSQIDRMHHPKLKLHDHFELLDKYDVGGVHLNSRNTLPHPNAKEISFSAHSLDEIKMASEYDYYFLSPIFDSISKIGYKSAFILDEVSEQIKGTRAIALGGVTPDKYPLLKSIGFYGAALLGHFFPSTY